MELPTYCVRKRHLYCFTLQIDTHNKLIILRHIWSVFLELCICSIFIFWCIVHSGTKIPQSLIATLKTLFVSNWWVTPVCQQIHGQVVRLRCKSPVCSCDRWFQSCLTWQLDSSSVASFFDWWASDKLTLGSNPFFCSLARASLAWNKKKHKKVLGFWEGGWKSLPPFALLFLLLYFWLLLWIYFCIIIRLFCILGFYYCIFQWDRMSNLALMMMQKRL